MLLVQGEWTNLAHLATDTSNWVVIDQPEKTADKVLLDYKAPVAAAIMLLMIAMMVFDFIPVAPVTAVIIAGLLTVLPVVSGMWRRLTRPSTGRVSC